MLNLALLSVSVSVSVFHDAYQQDLRSLAFGNCRATKWICAHLCLWIPVE